MEETNTEVVTPETTAEVTPVVEETQVTPEATETTQEVKETASEKKTVVEGLTYETPEELVKGVKEKDTTITKLSQELAELKKVQDEKKFEQQKTQVETGNVQLRQEYSNILGNLTAQKSQLRAEALANYNETGDATAYDYVLQQIDNQFDQAKGQLDNNYRNVETQLTQQQKELLTLTQQKNLQAFKSENTEFCEKYQPVIDKYIELGYDPQDLGVVKDLLNIALSTQTNVNSLLNENNEAKQKLVSSSTGANGAGTDHIFTRSEIAEMQKTPQGREKFTKHEKTIMTQMSKGLIQ